MIPRMFTRVIKSSPLLEVIEIKCFPKLTFNTLGGIPAALFHSLQSRALSRPNNCRPYNAPSKTGNSHPLPFVFKVPLRNKTRNAFSPKEVTGIHENISALQTKPRTRHRSRELTQNKGFTVASFSTAEEYDLELLKQAILRQQLYKLIEEESIFQVQETEKSVADVLHITARYAVEDEPREAFFFREGTTVFWNVSELEISNLLRFLKPYEHNSYDERLVQNEKEVIPYVHSDKTSMVEGTINLIKSGNDLNLVKYTFSNAIALSVKLGVWETSLERYVSSIEFIIEDLKMGRKIKLSREEVLRKQGELFALRHLINLSSDLLDTPDFYWDNDKLENLYMQTVSYLSISRRTRVMNEKLNHCVELVELVSSHLSDKHHVRLEWMIIVLIMVEVAFEMLHFLKN